MLTAAAGYRKQESVVLGLPDKKQVTLHQIVTLVSLNILLELYVGPHILHFQQCISHHCRLSLSCSLPLKRTPHLPHNVASARVKARPCFSRKVLVAAKSWGFGCFGDWQPVNTGCAETEMCVWEAADLTEYMIIESWGIENATDDSCCFDWLFGEPGDLLSIHFAEHFPAIDNPGQRVLP